MFGEHRLRKIGAEREFPLSDAIETAPPRSFGLPALCIPKTFNPPPPPGPSSTVAVASIRQEKPTTRLSLRRRNAMQMKLRRGFLSLTGPTLIDVWLAPLTRFRPPQPSVLGSPSLPAPKLPRSPGLSRTRHPIHSCPATPFTPPNPLTHPLDTLLRPVPSHLFALRRHVSHHSETRICSLAFAQARSPGDVRRPGELDGGSGGCARTCGQRMCCVSVRRTRTLRHRRDRSSAARTRLSRRRAGDERGVRLISQRFFEPLDIY